MGALARVRHEGIAPGVKGGSCGQGQKKVSITDLSVRNTDLSVRKFTFLKIYKIKKNAYGYKYMCIYYMKQRNGKGELEWLRKVTEGLIFILFAYPTERM